MLQAIKELFLYRDLLLYTVVREFKLKYGKSFLGILWALLKPAIMIALYYFVISSFRIINMDTEHLFVFISVGVLVWSTFTSSINQTARALRGNKKLLSKVYFPKEIPLIATVFRLLFEYFLGFFVLQIILITYLDMYIGIGTVIYSGILLLFLCVGFGFFLSVITVYFEDILNILELILKLGFWCTPVIWKLRRIPEEYHWIAEYNPVALIMETIRLSFIPGYETIDRSNFLYITAIILVIFFSGFLFFIKKADKAIETV